MKNYLVVYYSPLEAIKQMSNVSQEDHQKVMSLWMNWKAAHEENVKDFGAPLMPGNTLDVDANWSNSKSEISGYSILRAEDENALRKLFNDHPHLSGMPGNSIGIHEFAAM